jgi:hypothetical protein
MSSPWTDDYYTPVAETIHTRYHLVLGSVSKKVQKCKPSAEHIERHAEVVKEVKRRDENEKMAF